MANPVWPTGLKSCITSSKRRNRDVGFITSDVQAGPPFVELVTEDTPITYSLTFRFNRSEARAFRAWQKINNFVNAGGWFNMPIQIEEGLTDQDVLLIGNGFQLTSQDNSVFSYSATVLLREEASEDDKFPESIVAMFENNPCSDIETAGNLLDTAINISFPEA